MSFNPTSFIRSASPYLSPYSSSSNSFSSPSTSESLGSLDEPEKYLEHPNQFVESKLPDEASAMGTMGCQNHQYDPTLASPPRRFVVPYIVVTTPGAPFLPLYPPPNNGSTKTTTLYTPKRFARGVTKPTSKHHSNLRPQAYTAITLTAPYDFYYPSQPPTQPSPFLDPELFATLPSAHTYSSLVLPQLRTLVLDIESTMDTHLMKHLPHLHSLLDLLSPLPDFGLLTNNLLAFRAHVDSYFATARTQEEQYFHALLAVKPEPELKMVFRIFDHRYTCTFPRRAGCLIYPDDFEHESPGEMNGEEIKSTSRFHGRDQGGVGADSVVPALIHRQGWGKKAKYVVTASFAGDLGVEYPVYNF